MPRPDRRRSGRASAFAALLILTALLSALLTLPASAQQASDTTATTATTATSTTDPPPTEASHTETPPASETPAPTQGPSPTWSITSPGGGGSGGDGGTFTLPPTGGAGGNGTGSGTGTTGHIGAFENGYHATIPGGHRKDWAGWAPDTRWGAFSTAELDREAARLRDRGWRETRIAREVYAPFIVEGPATWSDSWGAPRYVGGYHPHHGQDVLCPYGAPVLAVQQGTVRYAEDSLGGHVAYLERPDGSFWYYAHLSAFGHRYASGDHVHAGAVIGRCGASGDATAPHVHFAFFTNDGVAVDPMPVLVAWLRVAEHRLPGHRGQPRPEVPELRTPRHPDATETPVPGGGGYQPTFSEEAIEAAPPAPVFPSRAAGGVGVAFALSLGFLWVGRRSLRRVEQG